MKKVVSINKDKMIEYKGDFYTPEELAAKLEIEGFEVKVNDGDETWFGKAMQTLENKQ